jgi:hypothetical protein
VSRRIVVNDERGSIEIHLVSGLEPNAIMHILQLECKRTINFKTQIMI